MSNFIAALPMYDWPEMRGETDALWMTLRDAMREHSVDAPDVLTRRNADLPPVPGGIRGEGGAAIAPDPATLPPDELDFHTLWRHPALLFGQTCWGPMELGLGDHVRVVGQPDYSAYEGGDGEYYSSAIIMRKGDGARISAPADGNAVLPLEIMRGARFAYNGPDSMSGIIALTRDLADAGETLDIFSKKLVSGAHRASVAAVANGAADVSTIDCRSWDLMQRFDDTEGVAAMGWTARRKGLPYITSRNTPDGIVDRIRQALAELPSGFGA